MNKKRIQHILRKALVEVAVLILAAFSWVLNIIGILNPATSIMFVVVCFFIIAYSIFQNYYKYEEKIDTFENSRPNIVVKHVVTKRNVETTDFIKHNSYNTSEYTRYSGGTVSAQEYIPAYRSLHGSTDSTEPDQKEQTFAVVDFVNDPERRVEIHDAKNVIARIQYKNEEGSNALDKEIKGLWEGNEPTKDAPRKHESEYITTTIFSNGNERNICVALKNKDDEDCFAYSWESYDDGLVFLRNNKLRLKGKIITIDMKLSGSNLDDKTFRFRLVNPGIGRDISITEIK